MTAMLIPFPADRLEGRVRHVAGVLRGKHGREADRYWRQTALAMRAAYERSGIDPSLIDIEIRSFAREVFARIPQRSSNPRGAA